MNTWIHVVVLPIIQCHRQDLQSDDGWRDSAVELVFSCAQLGVEAGRRTGRRVTDGDPPMKTWKKRWKTWNIAISKGTTRETWWNMMKDDERWWCLFSLLASRVSHFQTKPDRKGRKEMKHAKKHLCKESTWRKWTASFKFGGLQSLPCTPMYINSRLHCRSIEQAGLCCSNIKWVHWTGLNAGGTVTSFIGQKRVWSRLDKWWSPGHTGSLCFFCFIA